MNRFLSILFIILIIPFAGCVTGDSFPTYPTGGEYGGGGSGGGSGGGGYGGGSYGGGGGGSYNPPDYDYGSNWAREAEGEWEGFMWEQWRSDGRPLSKKMVAMRVNFRRTTYDYSGRHEWVKIDVLIDGRPVASKETQINQAGNVSINSYMSNINFGMYGRFKYNEGNGDIDLAWDEKVKNPWSGYMDEYYVNLGGDYDVNRAGHGKWAAAWALFDTYGDAAFDLDDSIWESATFEGVSHLLEIEESILRQPIQ